MNIDLGTIETLTKLADQFGPFLFAILFIVFVPRVARGYYDDCMKRTAPPSTEQEQKTYRFYFITSIVVGIAVMTSSIVWWVYAQARGNHVYQIAIVDLAPDETVLSDFFYKNSPRPTIANVQPMHDSVFPDRARSPVHRRRNGPFPILQNSARRCFERAGRERPQRRVQICRRRQAAIPGKIGRRRPAARTRFEFRSA